MKVTSHFFRQSKSYRTRNIGPAVISATGRSHGPKAHTHSVCSVHRNIFLCRLNGVSQGSLRRTRNQQVQSSMSRDHRPKRTVPQVVLVWILRERTDQSPMRDPFPTPVAAEVSARNDDSSSAIETCRFLWEGVEVHTPDIDGATRATRAP